MQLLLDTIQKSFSFEHLLEFTIEAGRPDSITREKLEVMRSFPVTRISVNPQTMQQDAGSRGRKHTVEDVKNIFYIARELGFDNINMDLIAGLPGETAEDMKDTLRQIRVFSGQSDSTCAGNQTGGEVWAGTRKIDLDSEIEQMVEESAKSAERMGMVPYYLYPAEKYCRKF